MLYITDFEKNKILNKSPYILFSYDVLMYIFLIKKIIEN